MRVRILSSVDFPAPFLHPEHLALLDPEAHVAQRPDLLALQVLLPARQPLGRAGQRVAKRAVRGLQLTDAVALREGVRFDRGGHQIVSANRGSVARKTVRPTVKSRIVMVAPTAA